MSKPLYDDLRSERNVFAAWRHVKRSALSSSNGEIRGAAAEFEHQHQSELRRILRELRETRFEFDPVKGILKDKRKRLAQGKEPRPIALATLRNRVVQRAILQVLQPRIARNLRDIDTKYEAVTDPRLNRLNFVNSSEYGVGGLLKPYGGVKPAINRIMSAIGDGAKYYYQSDIKSFFTKIPISSVVDILAKETSDECLTRLFKKGLECQLENEEELFTYAKLFPSNGVGVAQGSSLSAFAGNVLLYDFDQALNRLPVTAVRYIDDLLIVSKTHSGLDAAIEFSKNQLSSFGFTLYSPGSGSEKAAQGTCQEGIRFLGCFIQPKRCIPSSQSIADLKSDAESRLKASRVAIAKLCSGKAHFDPRLSRTKTLSSLGDKLFGWQKSFSFCTDPNPFRQLDEIIAEKICDYEGFISRKMKGLSRERRMTVLGIPNIEQQFLADSSGGRRRAVSRTLATAG